MGDVVTFPCAKRQGPLRDVRMAVPFAFKFDLGMMLRERAQVDYLLAGAARSPRIDEAHRLLRNAPTLAQLRRWQANAAEEFRRLIAPLAG